MIKEYETKYKNVDGAGSAKWYLGGRGRESTEQSITTEILYDIILSLDIHDGDWQLILVSMI